jgi:hypothetical protein
MADNIDEPWTVHRLATSKASLSEISARLTEAQPDAKAAEPDGACTPAAHQKGQLGPSRTGG